MLIWTLFACNGGDTGDSKGDDTEVIDVDNDHDGALAADDCDDNDPDVRPAAPETCDGVDENCNGEIDEEAIDAPLWYVDADGDGYGAPGDYQDVCEAPAGTIDNHDDCDDTDAASNPDGVEVCGDARDQDCDGTADDHCSLEGELGTDVAYATLSGATSSSLVVADIDSDGALDVAGGGGSSVAVLWGALSAGATDMADAGTTVTESGAFGQALSAGDFDLDGATDLAIANPDGAGTIALYAGGRGFNPPWANLHESTLGVGTALAAGDLDDDGDDDLLVGTDDPSAAGVLGVFFGPITSADHATFDGRFTGPAVGDGAGSHVAVVGDTNGDGVNDVLVGGPGYTATGESGRAWLLTGPLSPGDLALADAETTFQAGDSGRAGSAVSGAGDLDGDGYDDVVIGGPNVKQGSATLDVGAAWMFRGPVRAGTVKLKDARTIVSGVGASDNCGMAVAGGGDLNADGYAELAVACTSTGTEGVVGLFYGPVESGTLYYTGADVQITGEAGFGLTMRLPPDLTGDGVDDLLVTAPGMIYLIAGAP